jgi:hypothetical protein
MKPDFQLNAKRINHIAGNTLYDLTNRQLIFRIKRIIDNTTPPALEQLATISSSGVSGSVFYFNIDLTSSDLEGEFFYEFEINNGTNINDKGNQAQTLTKDIKQLLIQERLDN